jgi:hypothetical protein
MRTKVAVLEEALTGHFEDHHGSSCKRCWITSTR